MSSIQCHPLYEVESAYSDGIEEDIHLAPIGTQVFAREPTVREFDLGRIINIDDSGTHCLVKWVINDSVTWIPRILGCFQSVDLKRGRKSRAEKIKIPNASDGMLNQRRKPRTTNLGKVQEIEARARYFC